jgi:hypothetical protein
MENEEKHKQMYKHIKVGSVCLVSFKNRSSLCEAKMLYSVKKIKFKRACNEI